MLEICILVVRYKQGCISDNQSKDFNKDKSKIKIVSDLLMLCKIVNIDYSKINLAFYSRLWPR